MNNLAPLVSIIIPVYNGEKHILDAVESCLNQTYTNLEIIVVDDGSIDNTKMILEPFIEKNKIKYIYQKNQERSCARNNGIKNSKGKYIQYLDYDDLLYKNKIALQVEYLENNKDLFAVYCKTIYFNKEEDIPFTQNIYTGDITKPLLKRNFLPIHTVLHRNKKYLFDEKLSTMEDWDFWLQCSFSGENFEFIDEYLCKTQVHEENTTQNNRRMSLGYLKLINKHQDKFEKKDYLYFKFITLFRLKKYEYAKKILFDLMLIDRLLFIKAILSITRTKIFNFRSAYKVGKKIHDDI